MRTRSRVERNREELEYGGVRLRTQAIIDGARVPVVIDIGFGDAIEPGPDEIDYPVLLDSPAPKLRGYRHETVIAEKFEAIVKLGRANSRMKDFYDIWMLSRAYEFKDDALARAIAATFARRKTRYPKRATYRSHQSLRRRSRETAAMEILCRNHRHGTAVTW